MYTYPSCFTDDMIRTIADSARLVKYIDMPLQHINDDVLARMKRRVTRKQIERCSQTARLGPGIAIRTTFIAGSPGETDDQHDECAVRQGLRLRHDGRVPLQPRARHPDGPDGAASCRTM